MGLVLLFQMWAAKFTKPCPVLLGRGHAVSGRMWNESPLPACTDRHHAA